MELKKKVIFGIIFAFVISILLFFVINPFSIEEKSLFSIFKTGIIMPVDPELGITTNYTNNNMTIEFKDGETVLGKATLKSHKTYDEILKIPTGKNRTIIWYEFSEFKDVQIDALKGVEFIDMREYILNGSMKKEEELMIPNSNYLLPINKSYIFVYMDEKRDWLPYNYFDIPKGNITLGVQIDLGWTELLDVRFDVFGNKFDRHAVVEGVSAGFVTTSPSADPTGSIAQMGAYQRASKFTSPADATTITEMGWWSEHSNEEKNFEVGIYNHSSGSDLPNALLEVDRTNIIVQGASWRKVTGLNWDIEPNTIYWLAVQLDSTISASLIDYSGSAPDRRSYKTGMTTLTDPWESVSVADGYIYAIYVVYETAAVEDTCNYNGTGTWNVDCSDNCVLNQSYDIMGNILTLSGSGTFNVGFLVHNVSQIQKGNACYVIKNATGEIRVE